MTIPDEGIYRAVDCVAFSPDGLRVAAGAKDQTGRLWDVTTGRFAGADQAVATLRGHHAAVDPTQSFCPG